MSCPFCHRECPEEHMQLHHLKTRKVDPELTVSICSSCHSHIHRFFSNKELADPRRDLDSVEGLLRDETFYRAVRFIRKQDPGRKVRPRTRNSS